ncbi:DUF167 domain-containing protein [Legionella fallonii]|uniref:UPF0235 protein LFA_0347 n=1 Tax=Legionella fallonii LLAP-10 TaxID=1212491 RepID=A0A098G003_9GAMM|nr:DUF167 domain-containing protein [Legionella fallonii]CEG55817.1 conserved protein of unknown function [Legionella fallonii LLAP-10]
MWFKITNERVTLQVYVKPNASKTALLEINQDALHIAVHAQPQDGKANKELILFIAKLLKIPKTQIMLVRGQESRHKLLSLPLTETLQQFINSPSSFKI